MSPQVKSHRMLPWIPWLVLALSLYVAHWGYRTAQTHLSVSTRVRFDRRVEQIKVEINDRIRTYQQLLEVSRGLFAASKSVERAEWTDYFRSIRIHETYPGIQGVGFVANVLRGQKISFVEAARSDGAPEFSIHPAGDREMYCPIVYIEPQAPNRMFLGLDIAADTMVQLPAAILARDMDAPVITAKLAGGLMPSGSSPKFVMLLPVYRNAEPLETVEQRRAALTGWIYSLIDAGGLMQDILGEDKGVGVEVFDGIEISPESRLFSTLSPGAAIFSAADADFVYTRPMDAGGRVWMLNIFTLPQFETSTDRSGPAWVALTGVLASFLFFSITYSLVTTRRRAESRAEAMTARLRSVLATASDAFLATDAGGAITDWNRQAERMFGWARVEALGRNLTDLILTPKDRVAVAREMEIHRSGGGPVLPGTIFNRRVEMTAVRRDGLEFPAEIVIWTIGQGNECSFNAFVNDITQRRMSQRELLLARDAAEAASRSKSEFLANMTHELRTPLNSLIGFADILRKSPGRRVGEQELSYLDRIMDNAHHLLGLINDVLDMSKIEAQRVELDVESIYLESFIPATLQQLESRSLARTLKMESQVPRTIAPLRTDATKLRQVLINLIGNAIKFTHSGGRVTVRVEADAATRRPLRIDVIDTGVGIPAEKLGEIFEAFRQVERGQTAQGGTGLGLAISRSLCHLMGYRLEVQSEVGKGSTFSIVMPAEGTGSLEDSWMESTQQMESTALPTDDSVTAHEGRTALVIDDDPDARIVLSRYLEDMGIRVFSAVSGDQGIKVARGCRPDVITLDLMMRGRDGWDVLRQMRADESISNVPVIIISAVGDEQRAHAPEGITVLSKPVIRAEFETAVRKALEK